MSGFDNDIVFAKNGDFSNADNQNVSESNGLVTNGQLWIGATSTNVGGTHINVGNLSSPGGTLNIGYSSPNITLDVRDSGFDIHAARYIVSAGGIADGANYTTIASAYTAAVAAGAPQTIFVQPGTYTENLTLVPSIDITAFTGDDIIPQVTIIGKLSFSANGRVSLSNLWIQTNNDYCISVTGSNPCVLRIDNCHLNGTNHTPIEYTTANTGSIIKLTNTHQNIQITGISYHDMTSTGLIMYEKCDLANPGASSTPANNSAGSVNLIHCTTNGIFSASGTGQINTNFVFLATANLTSISLSGSAFSSSQNCLFNSGSSSAVSIGSGCVASVYGNVIISSNTNALTGSGTLAFGGNTFPNSSGINVSTQLPVALTIPQGGSFATSYTQSNGILAYNGTRFVNYAGPQLDSSGRYTNTSQPAFSVTVANVINDVTGDGTNYTIIYDTKILDVGTNFTLATGKFTAPVTGNYMLQAYVKLIGGTIITAPSAAIVTTAQTFNAIPSYTPASTTTVNCQIAVLAHMTAGDTASVTILATDSTGKDLDIQPISSSTNRNYFSGYLVS